MMPEMAMGVAVVSGPPTLHPGSMMTEFTMMAEFTMLTVMPMRPPHVPRVLPLDSLGRGWRGPYGQPEDHRSQQCSDPSHALLPRLAPRAMWYEWSERDVGVRAVLSRTPAQARKLSRARARLT